MLLREDGDEPTATAHPKFPLALATIARDGQWKTISNRIGASAPPDHMPLSSNGIPFNLTDCTLGASVSAPCCGTRWIIVTVCLSDLTQ